MNYFFLSFAAADESIVEEKFSITSYYPSPGGSYFELTTTSNTYLATRSGNVGIGTSEPQGLLQVGVSSDIRLVVSGSGNVGIGIAAPADKRLYVNGRLFVKGIMGSDSETPSNSREDPAAATVLLKVTQSGGTCVISVTKGVIKFTNC